MARGDELADVVIQGGKVFSVFTREWLGTDVAICDGYVAGLGEYAGKEVIHAGGKYVEPARAERYCPDRVQSPFRKITNVVRFKGRAKPWIKSAFAQRGLCAATPAVGEDGFLPCRRPRRPAFLRGS